MKLFTGAFIGIFTGTFTGILKSEIYKVLHSRLLLLHLLVPILGMAVFIAYYSISPWAESEKVSTYLQALAMAFPILIAVIMAMASEMEARAGFYQPLLVVPCQKGTVHVVKLMVLLAIGLFSTVLAVMGFGIGFFLTGNYSFSALFYVKAVILLFCGYIPLYELQYLISFTFPKGAGLGFGIIGSLISALMLTGLGDEVWYCLPWSISIRICSLLVESEVRQVNFTEWPGVKTSFIFIITAGILLCGLLILWGRCWEALKCEAE